MRCNTSRKLGLAATGLLFLVSPCLSGTSIRVVHSFSLKDYRGKIYSLAAIQRNRRAVVVLFVGAECPLARVYAPRMEELSREFDAKRVALVAIDSNRQDGLGDIDRFARQHHLSFPILKDVGNKVADDFNAVRTPEAFLVDAQNVVRYQGRIDDQYAFGAGVGFGKPQLKRRDLAIAVDDLLAGKAISVPTTQVKGCHIGRIHEPQKNATVTYANQISRLLNRRCVVCHRLGEVAPFPMTKYEEVAGWGPMIEEVVCQQRMPPWHANPSYGKFVNENVLSEAEKRLIRFWVDAGCPEGNPAELPAAPTFVKGWMLERSPDMVVYMADQPVDIPSEGVEPYRYYVIDPGFEQDRWVKAAQCLPGNRSVVHHIIVYVVPPEPSSIDDALTHSSILCVFAPGTQPFTAPAHMAKLVPAHHKLMFQVHYTTIGSPQKDRSAVGMLFEDATNVTHRLKTYQTMNTHFEIPPRAENYKLEACETIEQDSLLISLCPHMHVRGQSFRFELVFPDGKKKVLLDVPHYDFNWQYWYQLVEPLRIPAGSKMQCTAHYDNSENNIFNPDPTKSVRYGGQTWEEMMIGWSELAIPKGEAEKQIAALPIAEIRPAPLWQNWSGLGWQLVGLSGAVAIAGYALRRTSASWARRGQGEPTPMDDGTDTSSTLS